MPRTTCSCSSATARSRAEAGTDGRARIDRPADPVSPRAAAVAAAAARLPKIEEWLRDVATRLDDDDLEALYPACARQSRHGALERAA